MTSYFSALVDFVHAHSQYTHIAIFLLALSEAIPVVGTVVPGSTLIIGISALATSANANPWLLVIRNPIAPDEEWEQPLSYPTFASAGRSGFK